MPSCRPTQTVAMLFAVGQIDEHRGRDHGHPQPVAVADRRLPGQTG